MAGGAVLVSGCDSQLRAFDAAGGQQRYETDLGALAPGSPAVLADRTIIGLDHGRVVCLATNGSKELWSFEGFENHAMVYGSPAISDGLVVVGARDRNVYALDLATGVRRWKFETRGDVDASPQISDGRVYVGSKDKRLYVLDLKSGKKIWEFNAARPIEATVAIGSGVVVLADTAGMVRCLAPIDDRK